MRLFAPSRYAVLATALWFGVGYCFFGCEMGTYAAAPPNFQGVPAQSHHHHNNAPANDPHDCAAGCCKLPLDSEQAPDSPEPLQMQCCQAMASIALAKSKPPKQTFAVIGMVAAGDTGHPLNAPRPAQQLRISDSRPTYLSCCVLRI